MSGLTGDYSVFLIATREYRLVKKIANMQLPDSNVMYIIIVSTSRPQSIGGKIGSLRKHHNFTFTRGVLLPFFEGSEG